MTHPAAARDPPETRAKVAPVPERFSDLPLPECIDDEHDNRQDAEVDQRHSALRHRLNVETETRSWPAASRVDK